MRSVPFVLAAALAVADAYYYNPRGPWELESAFHRARAVCRAGTDANDATVEGEGCGRVDAALFRVVDAVEGAVVRRVVRAIDAEVETLFPHRARRVAAQGE